MEYRLVVAEKERPHKALILAHSADADALTNFAKAAGHKYFNAMVIDESDEPVWSLYGVFRYLHARDISS